MDVTWDDFFNTYWNDICQTRRTPSPSKKIFEWHIMNSWKTCLHDSIGISRAKNYQIAELFQHNGLLKIVQLYLRYQKHLFRTSSFLLKKGFCSSVCLLKIEFIVFRHSNFHSYLYNRLFISLYLS